VSRYHAAVSGSTARHAIVHASEDVGGGDAPREARMADGSNLRVSPGAMLNASVPLAIVLALSGGCAGIGGSEAPGGSVGWGEDAAVGAGVGETVRAGDETAVGTDVDATVAVGVGDAAAVADGEAGTAVVGAAVIGRGVVVAAAGDVAVSVGGGANSRTPSAHADVATAKATRRPTRTA